MPLRPHPPHLLWKRLHPKRLLRHLGRELLVARRLPPPPPARCSTCLPKPSGSSRRSPFTRTAKSTLSTWKRCGNTLNARATRACCSSIAVYQYVAAPNWRRGNGVQHQLEYALASFAREMKAKRGGE